MASGQLDGCRVLLTRPVDQVGPWRIVMEAAGAVVIAYPTIEVRPPPSWQPLDEALARVREYDWLIFTSSNALRFTRERWPADIDLATLTRPQVAAVGSETARELAARGFRVARLPEDQRQEGLIAAFGDLQPGTRVLFPQAIGGRETLAEALRARGCVVDVVPASETVPLPDLPPVPAFDVALFASPSAFDAFIAAHGAALLQAAQVVVIGGTTAAAAHAAGVRPLVAKAPRIDDIVDAVIVARKSQGGT